MSDFVGDVDKKERKCRGCEKIAQQFIIFAGKLILLDSVLKTIRADNLLENTRQSGDVLLNGLKDLANRFPNVIHSARGLGTFCAVDAPNSAT